MKQLALTFALALAACTAGIPASTEALPEPAEPAVTEAPVTSETETTTTTEDGGYPVVIATVSGDVEITARPERIVSLSPSATETLFAIGAGDQVIATDSFSYYPAEAPSDPELSAFEPNVEAIFAEYEPDLVIISWDPGELVVSFNALGVPVINQPPTVSFDDAYAQWEQLGAATGNLAEAVALVNRVQDAINEATADLSTAAEGLSLYHEADPSFYSAASNTFLGAVYARFGVVNIADEADVDGWGFPQLSAEYLVEKSPDIIFYTGCYGDTAESISSRDGWATITAVANGDVYELDCDLASRWGPRIVDLTVAIADSLAAAVSADA